MEIRNSDFGGFVVSKNVVENKKAIKYSFREESAHKELNGWTIYSVEDDDDYLASPDNFVIVTASTLFPISPVFQEIFEAPYGTDLCWLYEQEVHIGFYDLANDCDTDIKTILRK